ncbi:DUF5009 domain-containing protein [candidate division KSB1 bacterium]|nr:DUF5009 domain-containing protein [candidate division KSB1 bacterium]
MDTRSQISTVGTGRAEALDAIRGFAILTMVLSGVIPYGILPAWMYHAQIPPPTHQFNPNLPGLTWVDLVFPLFLFALGAAIPLALSRKLAQGQSWGKILLSIGERGLLLGFFAIYLRHIRPHVLNPTPTTREWLLALSGLVWMFLIFSRLPARWRREHRLLLRVIGWSGALIMLLLLRYPDGTGFRLERSDIILIVLTNMAIFASLIWLGTRQNGWLRLGILGILLAIRLAHTSPGWVHWLWNFSPVPWIYKLYYLQYLFIVIPGTLIGDLLNNWLNQIEAYEQSEKWTYRRQLTLVLLMFGMVLLLLIGMQARWLWQTTLLAMVMMGGGGWLVQNAPSKNEKLIKSLLHWGSYWLILGLFFESFEGGIKKDSPTMSYYFVTTGLAIFLLIGMLLLIQFYQKKYWLQLLITNGQNPMLAYVGFANFIWPILALSGIERWILAWTPTPWSGFGRGVCYTLILALLVHGLTRLKIYWRT